jgi:hypothetical protein
MKKEDRINFQVAFTNKINVTLQPLSLEVGLSSYLPRTERSLLTLTRDTPFTFALNIRDGAKAYFSITSQV